VNLHIQRERERERERPGQLRTRLSSHTPLHLEHMKSLSCQWYLLIFWRPKRKTGSGYPAWGGRHCLLAVKFNSTWMSEATSSKRCRLTLPLWKLILQTFKNRLEWEDSIHRQQSHQQQWLFLYPPSSTIIRTSFWYVCTLLGPTMAVLAQLLPSDKQCLEEGGKEEPSLSLSLSLSLCTFPLGDLADPHPGLNARLGLTASYWTSPLVDGVQWPGLA
jgi:hypothetical protein